jgi:GNAT superfamily N-acetyltransferase
MQKTESKSQDVRIRQLWLSDLVDFQEHLKRLDDEARHARLGHAVSDTFIEDYVGTTRRLGTAVFGAYVDGILRGVSELRPLAIGTAGPAEGAITVEALFQDRGIGSALMARLVEAAGNRGYPSLYMICLKDNARMRHIAHTAGASLSYETGDVTGLLSPPSPSPAKVIGECLHEASDFVLALFDQTRRKLESARH